MPAKSLEERFWERVEKTDSCWNWVGGLSGGYGQVWVSSRNKPAHRVSYELHNGPIPDNEGHHGTMLVCHKCDNKKCVNPDHLFLSDTQGNMTDMVEKGLSASGERHGMVKLTANTVKQIRKYYSAGGCTQRWLAMVYRVSQGTIGFILRRETWRHI